MAKKKVREIRTLTGETVELPAAEADFVGMVRQEMKKAIAAGTVTQYQISQLSGVPQSTLSRFDNGRDIKFRTGTKLALCLGFRLVKAA
jgi:hypothetical protein